MLTLSELGDLWEDFDYVSGSNHQIDVRPDAFDFEGTISTHAGPVFCPQMIFTMHYPGHHDSDIPYGGPPASNPHYMRFPVLSWGRSAGFFFTIDVDSDATLSFDRSFCGHVGDRLVVMVNGVERISITGSSGYPWTHSEISLTKGTWHIAFVLITATYSGVIGWVREGWAQPVNTITELWRYLRITNLHLTRCRRKPTPVYAKGNWFTTSTWSATGRVKVTSGKVTMAAKAAMKVPCVMCPPVYMAGVATLTAPNAYIGKLGKAAWVVQGALTALYSLAAHHASDTGGFSVGTQASLRVDSTTPMDISSLIRPLKRVTQVMSVPVIIEGRPSTPLASCISEVLTRCTGAQYIRRVDPHSPANNPPVSPTYRWLSIDAELDPLSDQMTQWHPANYAGPVWSTPGDYRPDVDDFAVKIAGKMTKVRYPAIQFDAGHLDHLVCAMPRSMLHPRGEMTWIFIGAFARYRGATSDNCPILDFDSDQLIDYSPDTEYVADRGNYMPWYDPETSSSIHLGLCAYSDKDKASSRFAVRTSDVDNIYTRTDDLVISDATPVILIYRLTSSRGTVAVTPLVAGKSSSLSSTFTRTQPDGLHNTFALGKSRVPPPYHGSFLTGSMSLLEVSYLNRAVTDTEITTLQQFYLSLYAPVAGGVAEPDYTTGTVDVRSEEILFYAADPETPLVLLSGNRMVPLGLYPSTVTGRTEMDRFNKQGVPVVQVSNRDYASLADRMTGDMAP